MRGGFATELRDVPKETRLLRTSTFSPTMKSLAANSLGGVPCVLVIMTCVHVYKVHLTNTYKYKAAKFLTKALDSITDSKISQ